MGFFKCPEKDILRAHILGKLDDDTSAVIDTHIEYCDLCETIAQQLDSESDSLVEILRKPVNVGPYFHEPELQRVLQSASENSTRQSAQHWLAAHMPEQLGRYRIIRSIGAGSMGGVYLAWDNDLDRQMALKVPHQRLTGGTHIRERFLREAKLAARIDHPNVCRIYDVGEQDGLCYLTMEYIEGESLDKLLLDHEFSIFEAVQLVHTIALAVEKIHNHNVIHRDLKPGNIILRPDGTPVVTDFGLALLNEGLCGDSRLSTDGTLIGSPAYMSPEQAGAKLGPIGPPTDVYSLGVILFETLTGKLPFQGTTAIVLAQVIHDSPSTPSSYRKDVPLALDEICFKAMSKDPAKRFASMIEFSEVLDSFSTGKTSTSQSSSVLMTSELPQANESSNQAVLIQNGEKKQWIGQAVKIIVIANLLFIVVAEVNYRPILRLLFQTSSYSDVISEKEYGRIHLLPDDSEVEIIIDGLPISKNSLKSPLSLVVGNHDINVERRGVPVVVKKFYVHKGINPPLRLRTIVR